MHWPPPQATRAEVETFRAAREQSEPKVCPNCHQPFAGLYTTPDLGPGDGGVTHCGCFYEGEARGKDYHASQLEPWQVRHMNGEPPVMTVCDGGVTCVGRMSA